MTPQASQIPLSLYVHFPWCVSKCPYCDFNSHALKGDLPEASYFQALLRDLASSTELIAGRSIRSVFMGGGTPSLMSPETIFALIDAISSRWVLIEGAEITLEANPATSDYEKFGQYRDAGVNRLSIGVQSFNDDSLRALGRAHSAASARDAVSAARRGGFENINIDLMFGLPGQAQADALSDVEVALSLGVEHVSHYQLTIEPNTYFHKHPPVLPDLDYRFDMQQSCYRRLCAAGLNRYEVSAWSIAGRECRHNLNYWSFGDYIGVGAGAHGKITSPAGDVVRTIKYKHPGAYLRTASGADPILNKTTVPARDLVFEFMLNALRLTRGFTYKVFELRTGLPRSVVSDEISRAVDDGLLCQSGDRVQTTELGARFLDDVTARFLPEV